jgi:hypothetical protein
MKPSLDARLRAFSMDRLQPQERVHALSIPSRENPAPDSLGFPDGLRAAGLVPALASGERGVEGEECRADVSPAKLCKGTISQRPPHTQPGESGPGQSGFSGRAKSRGACPRVG